MCVNNVYIDHGIYRGLDNPIQRKTHEYIPMSNKLRNYLEEKYLKFGTKIEFTLGFDPEKHIECLAVVHPKDNFNRKIGKEIVVGRIRRMRGEIREPYKEVPVWMYTLSK